jgi:signal transduction histidine kinase
MAGAMAAILVAVALDWDFVSPPGLAAGVVLGVMINGFLLWRARQGGDFGENELSLHASADLLLLTWFLAWSGGIHNPLSVLFSFHVVLGALLNGRRGALSAAAFSALGAGGLILFEQVGWLPTAAIERAPPLLWFGALGLMMVGLTYFALVLAQRLRLEQQVALTRQREAELNLRLFLDALDALKVGLELFDEEGGEPRLRNAYARKLRALPSLRSAQADDENALTTRFAVRDPDEGKRIVDRLRLARDTGGAPGAFLYVDRTEELLVEQRHVMLERLATLGRALQGIAHELNTPLMTMQTLAKDLEAALREVPLDDDARQDIEESVALIIEESRRCKGLTQSLLSTAQERSWADRDAAGFTLLGVVKRAVQLVGQSVDKGDVELDEVSLDVPVPRDPDKVLQILMNLLQNALKATDGAGGDGARVRVSAERDARHVHVVIADRGPGLPDDLRARLFEPFVTTRPGGEGTGLGLYVSQMIASELGGEISLDDSLGRGTTARITFPAHAAEAAGGSTSRPEGDISDPKTEKPA